MSGPKIDALILEQLIALELAGERSRNEALLRNALRELDDHIDALKAECVQLNEHRDELLREIEALALAFRDSLIETATKGYPAEVEAARAFNDRVHMQLVDMMASLEEKTAPLEKRVKNAVAAQYELAALETFEGRLNDGTSQDYHYLSNDLIAALIAKQTNASSDHGESTDAAARAQLFEEADAIIAKLRQAIVSDTTDAKRKTNFAGLARSIHEAFLKFDAGDLNIEETRQLLEGTNPILREFETHDRVMKDLYTDCLIERGRIANAYGRVLELKPAHEFSEESELEATLAELKEVSRQYAEDSYITAMLDRVMADHGYTIAKAITFSDEQQQGHQLFMNEHDDIGIHTYLAPQGVLAMEVAAVDDELRASDQEQMVEKRQATRSADKRRLVQEQKNFCELHPELIADLSRYGITVTRLKDKEPSEEHAVLFEPAGAQRKGTEQVTQRRRAKRSKADLHEMEAR